MKSVEEWEGEWARWRDAWEAAMAEAGYPRAVLDPEFDGQGWSYSWAASDEELDDDEYRESWDMAHRAFILVDGLRPEWVRPSPMLVALLQAKS